MLTKVLVFAQILLISLSYGWPFGSNFDADIDICENPDLSAGVVADDGDTYLFKGDYYWSTRPLTTDSGIIGYAQLTTSKWPQITGEISLVFTVSKDNQLITIFVVKNNWFGYQNGLNTINGTVDNWPDFKKLKVTTAFTQTYGSDLVYVLYSDNYYYALYDFTNFTKPKIVRSGMAAVRSNYLLFTEESAHSMPGTPIKKLIDVRAALTYKEKMFLLSKETFCAINLMVQSFERECTPKDVKQLLGCPLDLSRRTTSITSTTTTTKKPKPITTIKSMTTTSSHETSVKETFSTNWRSSETYGDSNVIKTGIPVLGREFKEEELSANKTGSPLEAGIEDQYERNREKSDSVIIIIIIVSVVIAVITIIIMGFVSKVHNKNKPKGEEIHIN